MDAQEILDVRANSEARASILREPHMSFRPFRRMSHCYVGRPYGLQTGVTYAATLILLWFLLSSYGSQKSRITAFEFHAPPTRA